MMWAGQSYRLPASGGNSGTNLGINGALQNFTWGNVLLSSPQQTTNSKQQTASSSSSSSSSSCHLFLLITHLLPIYYQSTTHLVPIYYPSITHLFIITIMCLFLYSKSHLESRSSSRLSEQIAYIIENKYMYYICKNN